MALIERGAIPAVVLPEEVAEVPELGGEVLLQGMDLARLGRFQVAYAQASVPLEGEADKATQQRATLEVLPLTLGMCVLAADKQPVYSPAEWAVFAYKHADAALGLWQRVLALSGLADEKKA